MIRRLDPRSFLCIVLVWGFLGNPGVTQAQPESAMEAPWPRDAGESGAAAWDTGTDAVSPVGQSEAVATPRRKKYNLLYYSIFYGPSLKGASRYQPDSRGVPDPDRPVQLRNYLGIAMNLTDALSVIPTGQFTWEASGNSRLALRDPFLRISHSKLINTEYVNLYGDVRFHFPVTTISRENDMLAGVQSFQALTWQVGRSPVAMTLFGSVRYNYFGKQGYGNDFEGYLAPFLSYQLRNNLSFTLLYEMEGSHFFGNRPGQFTSLGSDLEPGFNWEITPNLAVNPFLNVYPQELSLRSSSVGMTLYWVML
ncbi:MAG: hypothetical protein NDJ90_01470 [Oligoflexia bacterium]|nr:hypothetical protein [Oligoflexia bacterium]